MPDPASSPVPTRRRTSWWFRLLRMALNVALLGVLGLQLFTLVAQGTDHHLRLPGFARRALEDRLHDQGLTISFSGLDVSFAGSLLVHDPKIFLTGSTEAIAEANFLYVEPDWLTLLLGHRLIFSECRLINANFYCPPEDSPTGLREPVITRLDAAIANQGANWWLLDHLNGRFLNAAIFAQGTFLLPATPVAPAPGGTVAAVYRQWARTAVDLGPQFVQVDNPTLEFRLDGEEPGLTKIHTTARVDRARPPVPGLELGHGSLKVAATWDGRVLHANSPVFAEVRSVTYASDPTTEPRREIFSARAVSARIALADGLDGMFAALPSRCAISVAEAKIDDFACDSLSANLDLRSWPNLPLSVFARQGPDTVRVTGLANFTQLDGAWSWQGGDFDIRAVSRLASLFALAHQQLPKMAAPLKLDGPVQLDGRVAIAPGPVVDSADFTVLAHDAAYERIDLARLFVRGRLTHDASGAYQLELPDVVGENKSWKMEGAYLENLRTHDFRITGQGSIEPRVLDSYFKFADWWTPLWAAIVPGRQWPNGEVSYTGNWDTSLTDNALELSVALDGAKVRGVPTDRISVRVQTRPNYITVYDINARVTGGGNLAGALVWAVTPNYTHVIEQREIIDSTLPLAAVAALSGPEIADVLRPIECPTPPTAHLDQRVGGLGNPQPHAVATKIHAEAAAPFHAYGVPLESLTLDFTDYGSWADVPRCDFSLAGGAAHAQATIVHHDGAADELSFSTLLHAARDTDFIAAISQLKEKPAATAPTNAAPEKNPLSALGDPAHPPLLDLVLGGRMLLGEPDSLVAAGSARLYGAQLGQLHLLGSLSRAMADTKVALGDFNLTEAASSVQIVHQFLRLPNLVITGPTARVVSAGTYNYQTDNLNFNVLIFPVGEWDTFFLKQISSIMNPFSNALTFKLQGTLEKPAWNASVNPLRIFENRTVECPAIPGYPSDRDGAPILPELPAAPALPAVAAEKK